MPTLERPKIKPFVQSIRTIIADMVRKGYVDSEQVAAHMRALRIAINQALPPIERTQQVIRARMTASYDRQVTKGAILQRHEGVNRFTLARVEPALREELDKRIMASADLIRLNRDEVIEKTLRRFQGWATSIPAGGTKVPQKETATEDVKKALASLPYLERRVLTDQGHKLVAGLNETLATNAGAIAAKWHHHYSKYPRHSHEARDGKIYLLKSSWAVDRGFVKPGKAGWYDDITKAGEEINCRCSCSFLYSLGALPEDMLTQKGKAELARVRAAINAA